MRGNRGKKGREEARWKADCREEEKKGNKEEENVNVTEEKG